MSYAKLPVRLITIPVSHYCEKTRWALTKVQIPFVEERHMPPFHRFATRKISVGSNSIVVAETENHMSPLNRFISQRVGGQSVPVLVTQTGVLTNSEDILRYVDAIASEKAKLYPTDSVQLQQVEELVKLFDSVLAPAVRQWFYFYTFDQSKLIQPLWCQGVPWFERLLFPIVFRWMRSNVLQMYTINPASATAAYERICEIFERIENLLADGRTYLVSDRFSAADLTFATLAAGVVMPAGYGVTFPELSKLPSQMSTSIQAFRETLAGKFVIRLYQEYNETEQ
jgi:glutathione S-transferase